MNAKLSAAWLLALALAVPACVSDAPPPPEKLIFLDSQVFDDELRTSLASDHASVTVGFRGTDVTVNSMPARLDKWIYVVSKSDGSVEALPDPELTVGRSIAAVAITLAISSYKMISEYVVYQPARDYDAIIYYAPKSGLVTRVVFTRRVEEAEE